MQLEASFEWRKSFLLILWRHVDRFEQVYLGSIESSLAEILWIEGEKDVLVERREKMMDDEKDNKDGFEFIS